MRERKFVKDGQHGSKELDAWIERMRPLASQVENEFERGVAIYGAGFLGTWAASYLRTLGAQVTHFIDRDTQKHGTNVRGIPVVRPSDPVVATVPPILIAARHAVRSVQIALADHAGPVLSFEAYYVVRNHEKLRHIRDHYFHDEWSVETFNAILTAMLSSSVESCLAVMEKDMYFALPEFSGTFDEIYVDAGAFVGDTLERFVWENLGTFRHYYAFEPGRQQFAALERRIIRLLAEWAIEPSQITAVRAGLAEANGRRAFSFLHDSPLRHGLTLEGNGGATDSIDVYSLDSYLNGQEVTVIKADVEGMEMELLRGAQETICRHRPKMAICVYHYPSDLIDVADLVRSLVPGYRLSIRQHAPIFGDFVLYCY